MPCCEQQRLGKKKKKKSQVECARNVKIHREKEGEGKKKIPGMLQNTNILKQAGFLMYRLLPVNCTDETLKARQ